LTKRSIDLVDGHGERRLGIGERRKVLLAVRREIDLEVELLGRSHSRRNRQAKGVGRFKRVDHMDVVGEGLRKVFPWMAGCVRADEAVSPVSRRSFAIIALVSGKEERSE